MTRRTHSQDATAGAPDVLRTTLDDHTVAALRAAALERGVSLDLLIAELLRAACPLVDQLLDRAR